MNHTVFSSFAIVRHHGISCFRLSRCHQCIPLDIALLIVESLTFLSPFVSVHLSPFVAESFVSVCLRVSRKFCLRLSPLCLRLSPFVAVVSVCRRCLRLSPLLTVVRRWSQLIAIYLELLPSTFVVVPWSPWSSCDRVCDFCSDFRVFCKSVIKLVTDTSTFQA